MSGWLAGRSGPDLIKIVNKLAELARISGFPQLIFFRSLFSSAAYFYCGRPSDFLASRQAEFPQLIFSAAYIFPQLILTSGLYLTVRLRGKGSFLSSLPPSGYGNFPI